MTGAQNLQSKWAPNHMQGLVFFHIPNTTFHRDEDFNPQTEEPKHAHLTMDQRQNPLNN